MAEPGEPGRPEHGAADEDPGGQEHQGHGEHEQHRVGGDITAATSASVTRPSARPSSPMTAARATSATPARRAGPAPVTRVRPVMNATPTPASTANSAAAWPEAIRPTQVGAPAASET